MTPTSYAGIPLHIQQRTLPPCSLCDRPAAVRSLDERDVYRCARCEIERLNAARRGTEASQ